MAIVGSVFDAWETIYRQRLQVERNLLARQLEGREPEPANIEPVLQEKRRFPVVDWAIGLVSAALLTIDIGLLLGRSRRTRRD